MTKLKKPISLILFLIGIILVIKPYLSVQKSFVFPKENTKVTSGWKEYKNSEYHFSFKYPEGLLSNFQVSTETPTTRTLKQIVLIKNKKNPNTYNVSFEADGWKSNDSIVKFAYYKLPETKNLLQQKIILGNLTGVRFTNTDKNNEAYFVFNLFKKNNYIYNFAIFADDPKLIKGNEDLLNSIISTLKFY